MTRNTPIPSMSDEDRDFVRGLVFHEDASVLAFNKPSGLPVQTRGNRGRTLDHLLWAFAKSNGKRPRLVHRLDAGTSGVILAGRTKPAAVALSEAFVNRDVEKTYLAVVVGQPNSDSGRCEGRIVTDGRRVSVTTKPGVGDESRTDWKLTPPSTGSHTLLVTVPYSGRMHQIRAHLADMGCPILGDPIYGVRNSGADKHSDSTWDKPEEKTQRLMLHAWRLDVPHPDGGRLQLEAPPPQSFLQTLVALGLQAPPGSV